MEGRGGSHMEAWRFKMEPWRICRLMFVDHLEEDWIRIRIKLKSRIRIRISRFKKLKKNIESFRPVAIKIVQVPYISSLGQSDILLRACRPVVADSYHLEEDLVRIRIRIRIKLKSWIRIRIRRFKKLNNIESFHPVAIKIVQVP
jgi:hypothetical protein